MSWVVVELDRTAVAERCDTENDRMIRDHPSSPMCISGTSPSSLEVFSSKLVLPRMT
jgi:hypothetical protein